MFDQLFFRSDALTRQLSAPPLGLGRRCGLDWSCEGCFPSTSVVIPNNCRVRGTQPTAGDNVSKKARNLLLRWVQEASGGLSPGNGDSTVREA
jgi:hypothetical protein